MFLARLPLLRLRLILFTVEMELELCWYCPNVARWLHHQSTQLILLRSSERETHVHLDLLVRLPW